MHKIFKIAQETWDGTLQIPITKDFGRRDCIKMELKLAKLISQNINTLDYLRNAQLTIFYTFFSRSMTALTKLFL